MLSEAGAARPPDAATDLLAGARRAAERWSGHGAEVVVVGVGSAARCTAADLDRILDVLIENAIDYGPEGQRITLTAAPGVLSVGDEGPGLAPGEEETIFARFHRGTVGRASRRRGTGLGLPIARELAARWHGTVTLANGRDGGATAVVVLAADRRHDAHRPAARHRGCGMTGWQRTFALAVAAVAGLVLAAALTTAASTLSNQSVGLSSEPLTAGRGLAPTATATASPEPTPRPTRTAKPRPTRTPRPAATPDPTAVAPPPDDDETAVPAAATTTAAGAGGAGVAAAAATTSSRARSTVRGGALTPLPQDDP